MENGTIKSIVRDAQHGFITPTEMGQKDFFFHFDFVVSNLDELTAGCHVEFERMPGTQNKVCNVRVIPKNIENPNQLASQTIQEQVCRLLKNALTSEPNYSVFEELVFTALVAVGINTLYKFPANNQAGKPDGYFQCGNLSVIYDATIKSDEEAIKYKESQIENYAARLASGRFDFDASQLNANSTVVPRSFTVFNREKEVWIINKTQQSRRIKIIDGVVIKLIGVEDLIDMILLKRLNASMIDSENALSQDLAELGDR